MDCGTTGLQDYGTTGLQDEGRRSEGGNLKDEEEKRESRGSQVASHNVETLVSHKPDPGAVRWIPQNRNSGERDRRRER